MAVVVGGRDPAGGRRAHHAGIGTRAAAFIGSGSMAVAYFWKHQGDGLLPIQNDGDSAALFCWSLLLLVFIGSGRLALGSLLNSRTESAAPEPVPTGSRSEAPTPETV